MTASRFRTLALAFPEVEERAHMDHPDFRVRGKIFASLGPGETWAMVKLPVELQEALVRGAPEVFEPFAGAWGRQGCTKIQLGKAGEPAVREALGAAWRLAAPQRLADEYDARRS